jgi:methylthioribose-1-phosphate isomerase
MDRLMDSRDIHDTIRAVAYRDGILKLLDQRKLPGSETYVECRSAADVATAIRDLVVRGAPAIGIAAAWGLALEARNMRDQAHSVNGIDERVDAGGMPSKLMGYEKIGPSLKRLESTIAQLNSARPTAVNLAWALARMRGVLQRVSENEIVPALEAEAQAIQDEDLAANRRMGQLGSDLLAPGSSVMTHCNTGSLATAGYGTALGVIRAGVTNGKIAHVYAGETRPWLQGARLTMWELVRDKIPAKLIADSAAAHLMKTGEVKWVIVGADRIAANGDTANKIGTNQLAIVAKHHGVKFMVVAPSSTVDMSAQNGDAIEIELRHPDELFGVGANARHVVEGAEAWNPVFDVTPADLIDAIVTERGVIEHPTAEKMMSMFA